MGLHPKTKEKSSFLRYGALKGYIDGIMGTHGALFFEPYNDQPGNYGHWRTHTSDDPKLLGGNMQKMYDLIKAGLAAGFIPNVHAIGDRGVAEMLDLYERLKKEGRDLKGFRVIHAQVIRPQDFPRFKALNVIAEVNPYHVSDDMRWMEERIGHERCQGRLRLPVAARQRGDALVRLGLAGDVGAALYDVHPQVPDLRRGDPADARAGARGRMVPRTEDLGGGGDQGLYDQQRRAAFEADKRGSLESREAGRHDGLRPEPDEDPPGRHPEAEVTHTIVDGRIVFRNDNWGTPYYSENIRCQSSEYTNFPVLENRLNSGTGMGVFFDDEEKNRLYSDDWHHINGRGSS